MTPRAGVRRALHATATARDPLTGDLIFVRPPAGDRTGRLIAELTHGPYCHVRIRLSRAEVIEAVDWCGVRRDAVGVEPDPADVAHIGARLDWPRLVRARGWALARVGARYSAVDIADDLIKALLPQSAWSRTPFLVAPSNYDCSELACRFLIHAGFEWLPDDLMDDPTRCSPNDLARALGVVK